MIELDGKVVVVTGASRGLGAALAEAALAAGAAVGACSRGPVSVANREMVVAQQLDVRDEAALADFAQRVRSRLGPVDLWVNNAGVLGPVEPLRASHAGALAEAMTINVVGVMLGCQLFARMCREERRAGVLFNISSGAARRPYAGWSAYCASKAAVDRLSEVIAVEEAPRLRVHAVAPGVFASGMQERIRSADPADFPEVAKFQDLHRDGDLLAPERVAERLLSLAFATPASDLPVCIDLREVGDR